MKNEKLQSRREFFKNAAKKHCQYWELLFD